MRFVDIEEARAASGLRLMLAGNVPSPWSQAAMGIFDLTCAMPEPVRHAFETLDKTVCDAVPGCLLRHRDRMYERHLPVPLRF